MRALFLISAFLMCSCSTNKPFYPKSEYPPDPWVKGYAQEDDCLGGEKLAAVKFDMPNYPRGAYRSGRQGWVIVRLDVTAAGLTENIDVDRSVPEGMFEGAAVKAVKEWRFRPPQDGPLQNCRVLLRFRAGTVTLGSGS